MFLIIKLRPADCGSSTSRRFIQTRKQNDYNACAGWRSDCLHGGTRTRIISPRSDCWIELPKEKRLRAKTCGNNFVRWLSRGGSLSSNFQPLCDSSGAHLFPSLSFPSVVRIAVISLCVRDQLNSAVASQLLPLARWAMRLEGMLRIHPGCALAGFMRAPPLTPPL